MFRTSNQPANSGGPNSPLGFKAARESLYAARIDSFNTLQRRLTIPSPSPGLYGLPSSPEKQRDPLVT